jgi:hypothetical protein
VLCAVIWQSHMVDACALVTPSRHQLWLISSTNSLSLQCAAELQHTLLHMLPHQHPHIPRKQPSSWQQGGAIGSNTRLPNTAFW